MSLASLRPTQQAQRRFSAYSKWTGGSWLLCRVLKAVLRGRYGFTGSEAAAFAALRKHRVSVQVPNTSSSFLPALEVSRVLTLTAGSLHSSRRWPAAGCHVGQPSSCVSPCTSKASPLDKRRAVPHAQERVSEITHSEPEGLGEGFRGSRLCASAQLREVCVCVCWSDPHRHFQGR